MANNSRSNQFLGYLPDARLLIINADDFGMYHAINEGIVRSIKQGVVRSTSLMPPCPSASEAMTLVAENPDISFGVHLTIINDLVEYRYGPLIAREKVPSLIDESGNFLHVSQTEKPMAQAKIDELELEFRAQIEKIVSAGLKPSQLDWHCLHDGGREDIFELTLTLAREYGLALRMSDQVHIERSQQQGLPINEYDLLDSFTMDIPTKPAHYLQLLRDLPVGLSEWAVHPSTGDADSQTFDDGWQVRKSDYDFLMSAEAREAIEREGIILLSYRDLQAVWQQH